MKTVTHIPNVPKSCISDNDWDSHREALWLALSKTIDAVAEFGCGEGSTKMIEKYCKMNKRLCFSYETNKEYAEQYPYMVMHVDDYTDILLYQSHWGVMFIDAAPAEVRKELIVLHKDAANVMVIHDTEPGSEYVYGMSEILSTFKYRLNYAPVGKPHTSIVSNYINVEAWV